MNNKEVPQGEKHEAETTGDAEATFAKMVENAKESAADTSKHNLENPETIFQSMLAEARKNKIPAEPRATGRSIRQIKYNAEEMIGMLKGKSPDVAKSYLKDSATKLASMEAGLNQRLEKMSPADRDSYLQESALAEENMKRCADRRQAKAAEITRNRIEGDPNKEGIEKRLIDELKQIEAAGHYYEQKANKLDEILPVA